MRYLNTYHLDSPLVNHCTTLLLVVISRTDVTKIPRGEKYSIIEGGYLIKPAWLVLKKGRKKTEEILTMQPRL